MKIKRDNIYRAANEKEQDFLNVNINEFILMVRSYIINKCIPITVKDNVSYSEKLYVNKLLKVATALNVFQLETEYKKTRIFFPDKMKEIEDEYIVTKMIIDEIIKEM